MEEDKDPFFTIIKSSLVLICLLHINISSAQTSQFKNYSTVDGLPSSEVYSVMQDSKGYMWFSTERGVARFDGYTFKTFSRASGLAGHTIFEAMEDYKGRIWFRSWSGRLSYYYQDSVYPMPFNDSLVRLIKNHPITSLFVDSSEHLYLACHGYRAIVKINLINNSISLLHLPKDASYIALSDIGQPIMGSAVNPDSLFGNDFGKDSLVLSLYKILKNGAGTQKLNTWKWTITTTNRIHDKAFSLGDGTIAASLQEHFLILNNQGIVFSHTFLSSILTICPDKTGNIWIILQNGTLAYYKNGNITFQPVSRFLKNKTITSIYTDAEGGLWYTCLEGGVYYISLPDFKMLNASTGLPENKINSLAVSPDNRVWMCISPHILGVLDNDSIYYPHLPAYPKESVITGVLFNSVDNKIWVNSSTGIHIFEMNQPFKILPNSSNRGEFCMEQNSDGSIWAAGESSLDLYRKKASSLIREKLLLIKTRGSVLCNENKDTLLVGTYNGLWQFTHDSLIWLGNKYPVFKNQISDIKRIANGYFWIASIDSGIVLKTPRKLYHITTKDGLPSNFCVCLSIDYQNNIWVGSNKGISKITAHIDSSQSLHIENIKNISNSTLTEINKIVTVNNMVYVATNNGLTMFDMDKINLNLTPPPIYITKILVDNKSIPHFGNFINLHYDENFIFLDYVGLTYKDAGHTKYRYKMEGLDTSWIYTQNTNVQYPKLNPGEYTFYVSAMNNDGIWSTQPASVNIIIAPPLWGTWWAKTFFIIFILGIGYWRIKVIEKREKKKTEINKQLVTAELRELKTQFDPHFLFNSLNTLAHLVENKSDDAPTFVTELSKFYRYSLQFRDSEFTELETEIQQVKHYIRLLKIRFGNQLDDTFEIDEKYKNYYIPTYSMQLLLENAVKHNVISADAPLLISIKTLEYPSLIVKNQLRQKSHAIQSTGHGLASINERYKLLTGENISVTCTSEYFCVELPLINPTEYESPNSGR